MIQEVNRESTPVAADTERLLEIVISAGIDAALKVGWDPNKIDESGETLMSLASIASSPDVLQRLVAAGGNILSTNGDGETVLHGAVSHGHYGYRLNTINYILDKINANYKESKLSFINKQSDEGGTALMEAICGIYKASCNTVQGVQNSFKVQLLLLENGADPSIVAHENNESFIFNVINKHYKAQHAGLRQKERAVSDELKEYFNSGGCDAGLKEVLIKAIEKGLDINAKAGHNIAPITQTVQTCNIPLFKLLRDLGATRPDGDSKYFHIPCADSNDVTKMKCLIEHYDAIEKCDDTVKPAAEQPHVQDEL